jgi:hypothetical protein
MNRYLCASQTGTMAADPSSGQIGQLRFLTWHFSFSHLAEKSPGPPTRGLQKKAASQLPSPRHRRRYIHSRFAAETVAQADTFAAAAAAFCNIAMTNIRSSLGSAPFLMKRLKLSTIDSPCEKSCFSAAAAHVMLCPVRINHLTRRVCMLSFAGIEASIGK